MPRYIPNTLHLHVPFIMVLCNGTSNLTTEKRADQPKDIQIMNVTFTPSKY